MNAQWPPQRPPPAWQVWAPSVPASQSVQASQAAPPDANDDYANKVAEVSVLRNRLQQMERDNNRLHNELSVAREQQSSNQGALQQKAETERMNNELQYAKQDLASSEGERKRLQSSLSALQASFEALKKRQVEGSAATAAPAVAATQQPQPQQPPPPQPPPQPQPTRPTPASTPPPASQQSVAGAAGGSDEGQWRREVLVRELARWEAASQLAGSEPADAPAAWFTVQEAVSRLSQAHAMMGQAGLRDPVHAERAYTVLDEVAAAVAARVEAAAQASKWTIVQGGTRFAQVWFGLFPAHLSELVARATNARVMRRGPEAADAVCGGLQGARLFDVLAGALHAAVLDDQAADAGAEAVAGASGPGEGPERQACTVALLETLIEIAGKLRSAEFDLLKRVLQRPSLCALLASPPSPKSLHRQVMRLLQALLQSPGLFALAHQADSHENPLLAVANLLIIPVVASTAEAASDEPPEEEDGIERQRCRVAALELFCRCLATAPRLDVVLQLRGAPGVGGEPVDTVLQRVALLCHHELLCLGLHGTDGGPWRDAELAACAALRLRAAELSLTVLSSFVWHAAPWVADTQAEGHRSACAEACAALGRAGPLLASIVDMLVRRASQLSDASRLLAAASVLRALLAHVDGEDTSGCCGPPMGGMTSGATAMVVG